MLTAPPKPEYRFILQAVGAITLDDGSLNLPRAKAWLLEDREVIVLVNHPSTGRATVEDTWLAARVEIAGHRIEIELDDGRTLAIDAASCNCGFGAIAYAGPNPDEIRWTGVPVRPPDWVTVK